jgi:chaperone modulatory protein CbpM
MWQNDIDMDENLTCELIAEITGTRRSVVLRLVQQGLLEAVSESSESSEPVLPRRMVMRLRHMKRLRNDLGVNFTGAAIILDLMERIRTLNRELVDVRNTASENH